MILGGEIARVAEAARLAATFPGVPAILSGADKGEQAAASAEAALAGRIVIDRRPKNSFENALFSKELAKPKPGHRWNARDPGQSCAARDGRLPDRWSCPGRMKQAQPGYEIELTVLFGPFSKYIRVQQKAGHPAWKNSRNHE